jgi:hypothetical protein
MCKSKRSGPPTTPDGKETKWAPGGKLCGLDGCPLPAWHKGCCAVVVSGSRARGRIVHNIAMFEPAHSRKGGHTNGSGKADMTSASSSALESQMTKGETEGAKRKRGAAVEESGAGGVKPSKAEKAGSTRTKQTKNDDNVPKMKVTTGKADPFAFKEEKKNYAELARQRRAKLFKVGRAPLPFRSE